VENTILIFKQVTSNKKTADKSQLFCHSPRGQSNGMRKSATAMEMEPEKYGTEKEKQIVKGERI